jgi:hypothetical protein
MNRLVIFLVAQAAAQSPGNGISKSTYSCNDPIAAKKFMTKYFPVQTPGDECTNDICICDATGSTPKWYIQQGRVYVPSKSLKNYGDFKAEGRSLLSRRLQDPGMGFGLHCVNVSNHVTTGGLSTAEVEDHFTSKLGDMKEFDSFMDFSVTFYTSGVAAYASAFDKDGVPYYTTTWQSENGQSYTSLIVRVAKTQMILELTSKKSLEVGETQRPIHAAAPHERRMSQRAIEMIEEMEEKNILTGAYIQAVSVNRAVSSAVLAKLDDFYVTGMGTKKVSENTGNGYTRKCYLWDGAEVDVCFTNRDDSATKGDWKVSDFETMLNTVHKNIIVGHPLCHIDKWEDNHYAIDSMSAQTSGIVSYIEKNNVIYTCSSGMSGRRLQGSGGTSVEYIFDPTGWGIQADLGFTTAPTDCSTAFANMTNTRRLQGTFNPACDAGTCASGSTEVVV